ncbi:MAG: pyridine nucleotide-disulfide oxidoreductase [Alphaproteobacteria bacterium]|nr:pyridine nucleotide-disulfide oxidoreductase [Alphaproteobacteria bacterium]
MRVAVVGSGPAGCYVTDAILKQVPAVEIDVIERLPVPFGLIGYGVAPDHQTTKKVSKSFERTLAHPAVRFYGNVAVGSAVRLAELRVLYDAVVLATGAPRDRVLAIPGADKRGVIGATAFVGWYNGHPDFVDLDPNLDVAAVAVIGNGNVAIDVARVLVKSRAEMAESDLPEYAARAIVQAPIRDVHVIGRRGPVEASFTNVELREMGELEACVPVLSPADLPEQIGEGLSARDRRLKEKNLATFRGFLSHVPTSKPKRVHFRFFAAPVAVLGEDRVTALRFERTRLVDGRAVGTGELSDLPCGLVVYAIGNRGQPVDDAPFDECHGILANEDGRVCFGLYAVGWAMRSPVGVISTSRRDAQVVAAHIAGDVAAGDKPGRAGLDRLLVERGIRRVSLDGWRKIERAEVTGATGSAPRRKITSVAGMLALL